MAEELADRWGAIELTMTGYPGNRGGGKMIDFWERRRTRSAGPRRDRIKGNN